jgi:hypothetical protein
MAAEGRTALKTYFNTGDTPTEAQFVNLIDSAYNATDDGAVQVQPTEGAFADGDKTKLDGIEASADVTDETNVTAAFPISDATALVKDPVDATKLVRVDAGAITTATTRVLSMPDADVDLVNVPSSAEKTVLGNTSGTNTGDQTLPVKAIGSELDTGTDDAKFATALAIKSSKNVPNVVPGTSGNVLTSDGTDWTSATPAGGGSPIAIETTVATWAALVSALGAGSLRIGITADLTATSNLTIPNDCHLIGLGGQRTITMAAYYFDAPSVLLRNKWENLNITTTSGAMAYFAGGFDDFEMNKCYLNGGATASRNYWFSGSGATAQHWKGVFNDVTLYGGSSGDRGCLVYTGGRVPLDVMEITWNRGEVQVDSASVYWIDKGSANSLLSMTFNDTEFEFNGGDSLLTNNSNFEKATFLFNNCKVTLNNTAEVLNGSSPAIYKFNGGMFTWPGSSSITSDYGNAHMIEFNGTAMQPGTSSSTYRSGTNGNTKVIFKDIYMTANGSDTWVLVETPGASTPLAKCWGNGFDSAFDNVIWLADTEDLYGYNMSGGAVAVGGAVVYGIGNDVRNQRFGVNTTTAAGDKGFVGVTTLGIATGSPGYVRRKGYVEYANVDGTSAVVFGDTLGTHTTAGYLAKNTTAGERVGFALGAVASGTGQIPVFLFGQLK